MFVFLLASRPHAPVQFGALHRETPPVVTLSARFIDRRLDGAIEFRWRQAFCFVASELRQL